MSKLEFTNFITKGIKFEKEGERRIFEGHITAEIVDRQNEIIAVDQVLKAMKNYMKVMPIMTEVHSNRVVAKALEYKLSEIEGHPSVWIKAEVFKQDGIELYNQVWEKIVKGEYRGLSMGGASKNREPIIKDGKMVVKLSDLEIYEIAICPTPANQLAIIKYVNELAKAANMVEKIKIREDGLPYLQCESITCSIEKTEGINSDNDLDINNVNSGKSHMIKVNPIDFLEKMLKELIMYNKPMGEYADFAECEAKNKDKGDTGAYCGEIKHKTEDVNKEYKDGTTRATQAEMNRVNEKYKEIGEEKKDELTEPVTQKDVPVKDLVYKLQATILKNVLI